MTAADLPFADVLRASAGWNQKIDDWKRLLLLEPTGCFMAEWNGAPVGTITTTTYGTELAWIGMLLVDPRFRSRGIATALLKRSIEFLRSRKIRCIKLDATPAGQELYKRIGFREEGTLTRWENIPGEICKHPANDRLRPWNEFSIREIESFDFLVFGASRTRLISSLGADAVAGFCVEPGGGRFGGYGLTRVGARATYLGPIVADSPEIGELFVRGLLSASGHERFYWDIPDLNLASKVIAQSRGFKPQRPLTRMYLGENMNPGRPLKQFAIAGPEVG